MHNFNIYLFTFINQGAGQFPLLDWFFVWVTSYITYVGMGTVLIYLLWQALHAKDPFQRLRRIGAFAEIALSLFLTWIIGSILKAVVAEPRPFVSLSHVQQLIHTSPYVSFPSLHAALTMALAIAVLPYHKQLGRLLIAFSFIVALSRLYVGVHYPFDIGVGLLIGYLVPKLIHRIFARA